MPSRAELFNKRASSPRSNPDGVIQALALGQGQNIADIGSGGGYFAFRFAVAVGPSGKVYAVDTDPKFLEHIEKEAVEKGCHNITTVHSQDDSFELPKNCVDLFFMRNVSHHLKNRPEYFGKLKARLRQGGRVAIIEYKPGGRFSFRRIHGHYVAKEELIGEMKGAGYRLLQDIDLLPEQSFMIFGQ